jgi:hypothetical protein
MKLDCFALRKLVSRFLCFIVLLAFVQPVYAQKDDFTVSETGLTSIKIGMTKQQIEEKVKDVFFLPGDYNCREAKIENRQITLIFEKDILNRIDFLGEKYLTVHGVRIHQTEQHISKRFGQRVEYILDQYDALGYNLFLINENGIGFGFYITGGRVEAISVGQLPALKYVEGCH